MILVMELIVLLLAAHSALGQNCTPMANPPKLPEIRPDVRARADAPWRLKTIVRGAVSDTWKPTRRETGTFQADTEVEVLENLIVVDQPDILRITRPVPQLKAEEGDTVLRYARLGEGWADLWFAGCWYRGFDASFVTEPDGGGCGGSSCAAKVTKSGRQIWWFRIKLPNGKAGWTGSESLDLSAGG